MHFKIFKCNHLNVTYNFLFRIVLSFGTTRETTQVPVRVRVRVRVRVMVLE